jgi:hypothetical protein
MNNKLIFKLIITLNICNHSSIYNRFEKIKTTQIYCVFKQKSENLEKKALRVMHNVRVIHQNKKHKFI